MFYLGDDAQELEKTLDFLVELIQKFGFNYPQPELDELLYDADVDGK